MLDRPNPTSRLVPGAPCEPDAFLRWAEGREGNFELSRGEGGWPDAAPMIEGADGVVEPPALGVRLAFSRIDRRIGAR